MVLLLGGWVLLRAPVEPVLVEDVMTLTCRVRNNPTLVKVVFYRNGNEIGTQNDQDFVFPSLKLEDRGTYSCQATWIQGSEHHSGSSVATYVKVLGETFRGQTRNRRVNQKNFFTLISGPIIGSGRSTQIRCNALI